MEEATGRQLGGIWDDLKLTDKLKTVEEIVAIERSPYLYRLRGYEKAEIASDAPQSQRKEVESHFVTGPLSNNDFWDKEQASWGVDRGP
ncbi:conserved hypothetical protein [Aspergillus udagawae]|uniref:Uncharacterized protein n=1 Tax=Aspergillus udagawae TaxID=91492 RepID=A0A8H3N305_9EURO|nr:conserved hypothetical protein [Aspergillus udagawae]